MKFFVCVILSVIVSSQTFASGSVGIGPGGYDLKWLINNQIEDSNYKVVYIGFERAEADYKIQIVDQGELSWENLSEFVDIVGQRYSDCIDITVVEGSNIINVTAKKLVFVRSQHIQNSTYEVEGKKEAFTIETENESRERFFCLYDKSVLTSEWQKKAFLD